MIDIDKLKSELKRLNTSLTYELIDDIEIAIEDNSEFIYVSDGYEDKELYIKDIITKQ